MKNITIEELLNNFKPYGVTEINLYKNGDVSISIDINLVNNNNNVTYIVNTKVNSVLNTKTLEEAIDIVNNFNDDKLLTKSELHKEIQSMYEYGLCDLLDWFHIDELVCINKSLKHYIKFSDNEKFIPNESKILEVLKTYK